MSETEGSEATGQGKFWTSAPVSGKNKFERPEAESPEPKEQGSGLYSWNRFEEEDNDRR